MTTQPPLYCGTWRARRWHAERGEYLADCPYCGPWWAEKMRDYRARRRAAGKPVPRGGRR